MTCRERRSVCQKLEKFVKRECFEYIRFSFTRTCQYDSIFTFLASSMESWKCLSTSSMACLSRSFCMSCLALSLSIRSLCSRSFLSLSSRSRRSLSALSLSSLSRSRCSCSRRSLQKGHCYIIVFTCTGFVLILTCLGAECL